MSFVMDNSIVCGWLLAAQATSYGDAVAQRLEQESAVAPQLLTLEYTNVLRTACLRGRLTAQEAQLALEHLAQLPIDIDPHRPASAEILALALRYSLTAYAAAYLELALRRQLPIATVDQPLADAARIAGVGVLAV